MKKTVLTLVIYLTATILLSAREKSHSKLSVTHGPYLQNVTDTSATIMFTTNKLVVPGVLLSEDGSEFKLIQNSTDGLINVGDDIHKVRLTGLKPGHEYEYKLFAKEVLDMRPYVNLDGKYGNSIVSSVFRFRTFDRNSDEVRFTVFNDIHNKAGLLSRFLDGNNIENQDFYIFNGDILNYVKSMDLPYKVFIDTCVNRFASEKPFLFVRGNHETRGTYASELKSFFDFPNDNYYRSMDIGPVHFIILDSGEDKPDSSSAYFGMADYDNYRLKQLEWLKKEVKSESFKNASFRVVVIHMPIVEREKNWYGMAFLAKHFGPVLRDAGIDLMISGHTHRNSWIPANSSGFGYPVMIASNYNFTEVTADTEGIKLKLKDIDGTVVETYSVKSVNPSNSDDESSWFTRALEYKGIVVQDDGWNIWGCSPIVDDKGKLHLFVARWPVKTGYQGWKTHSEIAHYMADSPEEQFKFIDVVLQGGDKKGWDRFAPHNPTIHKVGNRYALFYIANSGLKEHPANQQIGLLLSNSLNGPWEKAGKDGLMLSPPTNRSYYNFKAGNGVVNPALLQKDGKFYLYFKSNDTRKENEWRPKMGLAIADNIEGPYKQLEDPITKNEQIIEDGYAFEYNNKVYLVTTDNHGMIEFGGGLIWGSEDGINFGEPKQAFTVLKNYLGGEVPQEAYRTKGEAGDKFERPQILMIDGKPNYIYMPSGTNVSGGKGSAGYVLKINL